MDVMTQRAEIDAAVSGKTVCTIFADAAKKWGDLPALRWKRDGEWNSLDWKGYRSEVAAVTMALRGLGFGPGQFGLIMARNVPEHVIADLGIVHAGGTAISVYNTLAPEQIEYVANHSEASVAIVEDEAFLAKFLDIRPSTPHLRHLILVRGEPPDGVLSWDALVGDGRAAYERDPAAFEASARAVGPEDTVSLIYTSGTTGPPKGVMYSQNNVVWTLESARRVLELHNETLVSYLPLAHVAETVRAEPEAIREINHRGVAQWRGDLIHVADGGAVLGTGRSRSAPRRFYVVMAAGGKRRGLLVDRLVGHQDVVVKGLDPELGRPDVVSGTTILGDGRVACILDAVRILEGGRRAG